MAWNEPPLPPGWDKPASDHWAPPRASTGLPDPWAEPDPEPDQLRRSLGKYRNGFALMALGLGIACLYSVATIALFFQGQRANHLAVILGINHLEMIVETVVAWSLLIGVGMIWGRWPDDSWRQRSGLLVMLYLVTVALWGLKYAQELGLTADARAIGHDWFRSSLRSAIGYAKFLLIAGLASEMADRQGTPGAIAFGRASRSLTMTGGFVWLMYFLMSTSWHGPLWPLRGRPNQGSFMIGLIANVLATINLFQLTLLSLMASRSCGQTLRRMGPVDTSSHDLLVSPSEAAWREFNDSRPNDRV